VAAAVELEAFEAFEAFDRGGHDLVQFLETAAVVHLCSVADERARDVECAQVGAASIR
jgi:hypothetical protein